VHGRLQARELLGDAVDRAHEAGDLAEARGRRRRGVGDPARGRGRRALRWSTCSSASRAATQTRA
jgi:hypothetical protein